ncbi:unnamed protein product [Paramecium octaurelia]|uniref:Uncharacterized protein n=1 Tax=Paramecium octaurelia TaxID=43137 RepID=A0A8S1X2Y0_PAROT|nr:unnamed protein product [Paramecium octaurelia]
MYYHLYLKSNPSYKHINTNHRLFNQDPHKLNSDSNSIHKLNMVMSKEDTMTQKDICQGHMMYNKKHHKLSKKIQQENSDPHKFNIHNQMYKQHIKQGSSNKICQISKIRDNRLSRIIFNTKESMWNKRFEYKPNTLFSMAYMFRLEDKHKRLANMCYKHNYWNNSSNQVCNSHMNHYYQIILDRNSKILKYNKLSLHIQQVKIRQILNRQLDMKTKIIDQEIMRQTRFDINQYQLVDFYIQKFQQYIQLNYFYNQSAIYRICSKIDKQLSYKQS